MKYQVFLGMFSAPVCDQQLYQTRMNNLIKNHDQLATNIIVTANNMGFYSEFCSQKTIDIDNYIEKIMQFTWSTPMMLFPHGPRPIINYCIKIDNQVKTSQFLKNVPIIYKYNTSNVIYNYYPKQLQLAAAATQNPEIDILPYKYDLQINQDYSPISNYLQLCNLIPRQIYQAFLQDNYLYFQPEKNIINYIKNKNINNQSKIILHINHHLRDLHNKIQRDLKHIEQIAASPQYISNNLGIPQEKTDIILQILNSRKQERSCELICDFPKYSGALWCIKNPTYYNTMQYIWSGKIVVPAIVQLKQVIEIFMMIQKHNWHELYPEIILEYLSKYQANIEHLTTYKTDILNTLIDQLLLLYQSVLDSKSIIDLNKLLHFAKQNWPNVLDLYHATITNNILQDCVLYHEFLNAIDYAKNNNKLPTGRGDPLGIKSIVNNLINFYIIYQDQFNLPVISHTIYKTIFNKFKKHHVLQDQLSITAMLYVWNQPIELKSYYRIKQLYNSSVDGDDNCINYEYLLSICQQLNYRNMILIGAIIVKHIHTTRANHNSKFREILKLYINFIENQTLYINLIDN